MNTLTKTSTGSKAPKPRISERIAKVSPSATLAIDAKAKKMKSEGIDMVLFGAGEPDFPTPDHIVEAAVAACRNTANHRYTPTSGLADLREAIVRKTKRDTNYDIDVSQVLVTNGGKHAIANSFAVLLDPGDEVLLPAPYWTTYPESVALAGGVAKIIPTDASAGFKVTPEMLEAASTEKTKVLLMVSPSNPTGAVYDRDELLAIGQLALEKGWWIITDEIYEHLVYDGLERLSLPVLVEGLKDRCIIVNGVAKTYAMTGWRVGWMIGPKDVIEAATNLQSHETSNVANVSQRAAIAALEGPLDDVAKMREAFDRRRKLIVKMLNEIEHVECLMPQGAFYAFPSLEAFYSSNLAGRNPSSTLDIADIVLEEAKVAFVPGEAFGAPGYARFSYATSDEEIVKGIERLGNLLRTAKF